MIHTHMNGITLKYPLLDCLCCERKTWRISQSTPLACIDLLKHTFGKTNRDLLQYLQSPMMKLAQSPVPQIANVSALHPFYFCAQSITLLYLQLIDILHLNSYLLYLTRGYVLKKRLSFQEYYIIDSILKHGNGY